MSAYVRSILTEDQEQNLVRAIEEAERLTSGEIRIHIERTLGKKDPVKRAKEVFAHLKMHETAESNGVLFYLAVEDRALALWAGEGINARVTSGFWDEIIRAILSEFKTQHFSEGLQLGVQMTGKALSTHFPWQRDDINELSNEISKGE